MGVDGRVLDGLFTFLVVVGAIIGITIFGIIWLLVWLISHIHWSWS